MVTAADDGDELTCEVVATGPGGDSGAVVSEPVTAYGRPAAPGVPRLVDDGGDPRTAFTLEWAPTPAEPVPADGYIVQYRDRSRRLARRLAARRTVRDPLLPARGHARLPRARAVGRDGERPVARVRADRRRPHAAAARAARRRGQPGLRELVPRQRVGDVGARRRPRPRRRHARQRRRHHDPSRPGLARDERRPPGRGDAARPRRQPGGDHARAARRRRPADASR